MYRKYIYTILFLCFYSSAMLGQWQSSLSSELLSIPLEKQMEKRFYVFLPQLSADVVSGGFTYGDIYSAENKTLSLNGAAALEKDFDLLSSAQASYGGIGVRLNQIRLSIMHNWKGLASIHVPQELFSALTLGNAFDESYSVTINPRIFHETHHQWAFGMEYLSEKILVGAQANLIFGGQSIYTQNFDIDIVGEEDFFVLDFYKNIEIHASGTINYNNPKDITYIGSKSGFEASPFSKNVGIGINVFAKAEVNDRLWISARVEDLGYVNWKRQAVTYTDNSISTFKGIDLKESLISDEPISIQDTLYGLLQIDKSVGSFRGRIFPNLGERMHLQVTEKIGVFGEFKGQTTGIKLLPKGTIGMRISPLEALHFSLANTAVGSHFLNPEIGLSTQLFDVFNIYLQTANPWKIGKYYDLPYGYFAFGMFLQLG